MPSKYVFTITTGRSGSVFLTDLLEQNAPDSKVFHERTGYTAFGETTPDLSHFTLFNSVGNVPKVRDFWKRKFHHDSKIQKSNYIETSHLLSKAGLFENIDLLQPMAKEIHIIIMRRDIFKIVWSLYNRGDFANLGFTWLYYLDPRYPNKILLSDAFNKHGQVGWALWYVLEMFARAEYYKLLLADTQKVHIHDIDLSDITKEKGALSLLRDLGFKTTSKSLQMPPKANQSNSFKYGQKEEQRVRQLVDGLRFNAKEIAAKYYDSGMRLGTIKERR
ncbi:MAG: hypothetical protein V7711_01230 [Pseudomonadales bacterium]